VHELGGMQNRRCCDSGVMTGGSASHGARSRQRKGPAEREAGGAGSRWGAKPAAQGPGDVWSQLCRGTERTAKGAGGTWAWWQAEPAAL